ncbi:MAG: amidase [Labilithrix sp.]|nr:amidase [Labilithrix sp.]
MQSREILASSAIALARAIRERRVTSAEVVRVHVERVRKVNPAVNAVVRDRFDDALREARAADEKTASVHADDLPVFHGVPCTIKEAFAFEGMPNTSGLWARRDVLASKDATVVERMRGAGAIPLGVTNVSELCMWFESTNKVWGRTSNAYDPRRTAGGSSGGEGAIVGAGASPIGLGSDVGGSIRMPAFFNGVFGHKATGGIVPSTGNHPPALHDVQRFVTCGPLTRRAEDLMPMLRVVAGPDGVEENCTACDLRDPASVDLRSLTVFSVERGPGRVEPALLEAQRAAARALADRGARVERREIRGLARSFEIWSAMLNEGRRGKSSFRELMAAGGRFDPWREIARFPLGRSRYTLPGLLLSVFEELPDRWPARARALTAMGRELRAELANVLGDRGVMLYPSFPRIAPRHNTPLLAPFQFAYTAIFNVMEMPSTQVPLGLDRRGLPIGVQVAAVQRADHLTIAVAMELERVFGGWRAPAQFA